MKMMTMISCIFNAVDYWIDGYPYVDAGKIANFTCQAAVTPAVSTTTAASNKTAVTPAVSTTTAASNTTAITRAAVTPAVSTTTAVSNKTAKTPAAVTPAASTTTATQKPSPPPITLQPSSPMSEVSNSACACESHTQPVLMMQQPSTELSQGIAAPAGVSWASWGKLEPATSETTVLSTTLPFCPGNVVWCVHQQSTEEIEVEHKDRVSPLIYFSSFHFTTFIFINDQPVIKCPTYIYNSKCCI